MTRRNDRMPKSLGARAIRAYRRLRACLAAAAFALVLSGCVDDPLGLGDRTIAGAYELTQRESGLFGVDGPHRNSDVTVGVVHELAWNDNWIFVRSQAFYAEGGDGAWVVVDVKNQQESDFVSDARAREMMKEKGLTVHSARQAWKLLR